MRWSGGWNPPLGPPAKKKGWHVQCRLVVLLVGIPRNLGLIVTPCRVTTLLRAQARLYAEALSLYTPHNGAQIYTVALRGAVEYVVSIIAVA